MSSLLRATVNTQLAVRNLVDRKLARLGDREKGQASAEYAGIIIVAVTLVGLLIAAATAWGDTITDMIGKKIKELGTKA